MIWGLWFISLQEQFYYLIVNPTSEIHIVHLPTGDHFQLHHSFPSIINLNLLKSSNLEWFIFSYLIIVLWILLVLDFMYSVSVLVSLSVSIPFSSHQQDYPAWQDLDRLWTTWSLSNAPEPVLDDCRNHQVAFHLC